MRIKLYLIISIVLFSGIVLNAKKSDLTDYVDPYIGSGGHGHVFVGANVPFGMVQIGPQNIHKGWDWCSGYHYSDSIVIGFSHTHLSGTGCTEMGDIIVMPFTGKIRTKTGNHDNISGSCASYYKHENEQVSPGYYSLLMDNGVKVELTATERTAFHQYSFPEGEKHVLINLAEGNGDRSYDTYLKKLDDYTIEGYRFSRGWSPTNKVFFILKTQQPIESFYVYVEDAPVGEDEIQRDKTKGVISFKGNPNQIRMKVAISSVSCANAAMNMEKELSDWNFESTHLAAIDKWNNELERIKIETQDERAKTIFYSALYHYCFAPTLYCDVNGEFRGHDDKIRKGDMWTNYSTFSLWDTYRAWHPLLTIINPQLVPDLVNSMLSIYDQQGKLPIWPLFGGETNCMPGYSAVPVIADAYLKGIKGFDAERAFQAMLKSTTLSGQVGVPYVIKNGFIPTDRVGEATSIAMEYCVGDWAVSQVAEKLARKDIADKYKKRGKYYAGYFDQQIGFIRPRNADGKFVQPYNPFTAVHGGVGYFCEGNGWQYSFFVPQHPEGLIKLFGGDKKFVTKIDSLFQVSGDMGKHASDDISGLIGMYAHGNEPSHHVAYLYAYVGEQWKTAEKVRYIQDNFYTDKPDGIIGNEDCGQMSAWHIISALGFYQVNPSNGVFVFGSPLFDKAEIKLPGAKSLQVITTNNNKKNIYIQSVERNGKPYKKSYIRYEDLMEGGTLTFVMGDKPNKSFGTEFKNRPSSE